MDGPAAPTELIQRSLDRYERQSAAYLDDLYTSYVHTPTITLALGYQVF